MCERIPTEGLHFIGNGRVAMAGEGADILQLFAPCYSLPTVLSLCLSTPELRAESRRRRGSAAYETSLCEGDIPVGEILDFTHATSPVFVRRLSLAREVAFTLRSDFSPVGVDALTAGAAHGRLFTVPEGATVFSGAKTDKETVCCLLLSPTCTLTPCEGGGETVTFPAGESFLLFLGGDYGEGGHGSFSSCMELTRAMLTADLDGLYADFLSHWESLLEPLARRSHTVEALPHGDELTESVAVALLTQTSAEGGVMAGAFYHLAYGRDMYGVFRGYMALGLTRHARRMVEYMTAVFREKGSMPNASGMGMGCSHRHENDEVEQTGYYLLELCEYVTATGDVDFLRERMDYALYLLTAQEGHLAGGMLPFNGDETYIAGGLFPRSGIDHGSMEATALYLGSAEWFLTLCDTYGLLPPHELALHRATASEAAASFEANFTEGETVYVNQPARVGLATLPDYRHGVCHRCLHVTHLLRAPEGGYLCPACYGRAPAPITTERIQRDCALWMTVFAGCDRLSEATLRAALSRTEATLRATDFGAATEENTVGYEAGVLLFALSVKGLAHGGAYAPLARELLDVLLSRRVEGSVWQEYDRGGRPTGCPYRPWESAINLCGILAYLGGL